MRRRHFRRDGPHIPAAVFTWLQDRSAPHPTPCQRLTRDCTRRGAARTASVRACHPPRASRLHTAAQPPGRVPRAGRRAVHVQGIAARTRSGLSARGRARMRVAAALACEHRPSHAAHRGSRTRRGQDSRPAAHARSRRPPSN